ncbi:MAG: hypothetical protein IT353_11410 [Gemmatimonadaceae bacterium]|nr:hypothetical protein [Gemmatimonadaceae bacterium]
MSAFMLASAESAAAQTNRPLIAMRGGILGSSDAYQANCGHSSLSIGAEVRGRRAIFPWASADRGVGSGGGDVACLTLAPRTGGLLLEGSTMLSVGAGWQSPPEIVQIEGLVGGGLMIGKPGFGAASSREVRPRVVGTVGLVLLRHVVFSLELGRTQLSFRDGAPGNVVRSKRWESTGAGRIGLRF